MSEDRRQSDRTSSNRPGFGARVLLVANYENAAAHVDFGLKAG